MGKLKFRCFNLGKTLSDSKKVVAPSYTSNSN